MSELLPPAGRVRRGGLALLASLLLHAALVLGLLYAPVRSVPTRPGFHLIDQRVKDAGPEVSLFLADVPERVTLLSPPPVLAPADQHIPTDHTPAADPEPAMPVVEPTEREHTPGLPAPSSAGPPGDITRATHSGGPVSGGEVGISFFQLPARGQSIVYVLDRSASMGLQQMFTRGKRELLRSLDRLPQGVCFQVVAYNRTAEVLQIGGKIDPVPGTPENRREAARLLEALVPEGGTDHAPALRRALALKPDVIYFLTDAGDLKPGQTRALTQANRGRSVIHAIVLRPEAADAPLRALARENGGEYRAVTASP